MKSYNDTDFITGMRFYAVLLVFFAHSSGTGIYNAYPDLSSLYYLGKYGVDIFFVISGFTIYAQLSNKRIKLTDFLRIRFLRITSAYWPLLVVLIIYYSAFDGPVLTGWFDFFGPSIGSENIIAHFFFLGSIFPEYSNSLLGVEWSLNIEIFYYLFFGFLFFYFACDRLSKLLVLLALLFMLSILAALLRSKLEIAEYLFLWTPLKYGYMFALGAISLLARDFISMKGSEASQYKYSDISIIFCFFVLCVLCVFDVYLISSFLVSFIFALMCFILLIFVKKGSILSLVFTSSWIVFFGAFSFSFYLVHYPVTNFINSLDLGLPPLATLLFNFILSSVIAYIWYIIFESKLYNGIKRKWFEKECKLSSIAGR